MEHNANINGDSGDTVVMKYPITHGTDVPGMRAAHTFANASELVVMMGDHLPDEDLPRLCLVNSRFNGIYSQRLYRGIHLDARFLQPKVLAWVSGNPRFSHTKILSFDKKAHFDADAIPGYEPRDGPPWGIILPEWIRVLVQKTATDVLRKATNLHTINTPIGSDKAVLIINNGFDGKFRRSSTKLQSLTLSLSATPCRELSASVFQAQSLKCLCLTNIPTASWRVDLLCQILKESPGIRYLELSYLNGLEHQWSLEEICKRYQQLGGAPVELEVLILGRGVDLRLPAQVLSAAAASGMGRSAKAFYLSLLTDPACVREMRITAANNLAWSTFDASFFPNMEDLYLSAPVQFRAHVLYFLLAHETRDLLRQVHFHIDGSFFWNYANFKDMTRRFFSLLDLNNPASSFAPMGFSFHLTLLSEHSYRRSIPLPLPTTRCLDITIHYRHLAGFVGTGLSKMSALECLSLGIYVYGISEWDDEIGTKKLSAMNKAANTCPKLRYIRLRFGAAGPVSPRVAAHSCSAEIVRQRRPGPRCRKLFPGIKPLDAGTEKSLRPQSMWTEEERKSQYVSEFLDGLVYFKPSWMK